MPAPLRGLLRACLLLAAGLLVQLAHAGGFTTGLESLIYSGPSGGGYTASSTLPGGLHHLRPARAAVRYQHSL